VCFCYYTVDAWISHIVLVLTILCNLGLAISFAWFAAERWAYKQHQGTKTATATLIDYALKFRAQSHFTIMRQVGRRIVDVLKFIAGVLATWLALCLCPCLMLRRRKRNTRVQEGQMYPQSYSAGHVYIRPPDQGNIPFDTTATGVVAQPPSAYPPTSGAAWGAAPPPVTPTAPMHPPQYYGFGYSIPPSQYDNPVEKHSTTAGSATVWGGRTHSAVPLQSATNYPQLSQLEGKGPSSASSTFSGDVPVAALPGMAHSAVQGAQHLGRTPSEKGSVMGPPPYDDHLGPPAFGNGPANNSQPIYSVHRADDHGSSSKARMFSDSRQLGPWQHELKKMGGCSQPTRTQCRH
jgi:hypothetical protein